VKNHEGIPLTVNIRFIGAFRSLSGKSKFDLILEKPTSLETAIERILEKTPSLRQALGNRKSGMLVLLNGKEISVLDGLKTMIEDGDEVVFVPVTHGG
jgi:molybdopterin converting factor small subunit